MKRIISITFALLLMTGCMTKPVDENKKFDKLLDFEKDSSDIIHPNAGADATIVDSGSGKALKIKFKVTKATSYPGVTFTFKNSMDWTDKTLDFDLINNTDKAVTFNMRVDSVGVDNAGGVEGAFSYVISAAPNSSTPVTLLFTEDGRDYGMRGLPGSINKKLWGANLKLDQVFQFIIYQVTPKEESEIIVDNFRATPSAGGGVNVSGIIDEFGQYSGAEYKNKIHSVEELKELSKAEEKELSKVIPGKVPGRSQYGGWLNEEKRLKPSEFFRAEKVGDKWWLVDPDGYLFFSTGLDIIRIGDAYTVISSREDMFESIPSKDSDLGDHWGYANTIFKGPVTQGDIFNFYTANLERKYGENWYDKWKETQLKRTAAWGFTSFGNWSDIDTFWGKGEENKISYFGHGWINGNYRKLSGGNNYWGPLPDPYDPLFKSTTKSVAETLASQIKDDPWCIGVFVNNEMSWGNNSNDQMHYGLIYSAFNEQIDSPAKSALLQILKDKYSNDISKLNSSWGKKLTWERLELPYNLAANLTAGMKADLGLLLYSYAKQYYTVVRNELRAAGIKQMYLGSRLADWGMTDEVFKAASEVTDIVSINWYKTGVEKNEFKLAEELDVPMIIGEFHFGATDRGQFMGGIVPAGSQEARGEMYKNYIQTVLDNPFFVGAHWFQLYDQPVSGRAWDGENYNTGFVTVTDIPYEPLVKAAKSINDQVYTIRDSSTVYYNQALVKSTLNSENLNFEAYKSAKVTTNNSSLEVNVGSLDSDYSGLYFKPANGSTWNLGTNPAIKIDAENPNNNKIQIRLNISDIKGNTRTFYFNMNPKEKRTLEIKSEDLGIHPDKWGNPDGYWGAAATGLNTEKITLLNFYIWEDNDFGSDASTFNLANLQVENM